ncbi:glycoside hydrolase family 2 TIM barrel-domain containing protein [Vibrio sp. qd031]|uniref:glycoside hydrolase family 2 protein n=1 Tax=Vibrio sp. qd031 TaxID=1603038 RepID=UPI000A11E868|nr:glycoside hydrolase family 2 TIM barrel-domain containing protein [Vibrio sp. qd031]
MHSTQFLYEGWWFGAGHHVLSSLSNLDNYQQVTLPHNSVDLPLNYFDETVLHQDFTYHKVITISETQITRQQVMTFQGVMCDAHVYVNGVLSKAHSDGFTSFDVHLNPFLKLGENLITVTLSGKENPAIPPFGGRIDYLCFPGIYRDVTISEYDEVRIKNVKIDTLNVLHEPHVQASIFLEEFSDDYPELIIEVRLLDSEGKEIAQPRTVRSKRHSQRYSVELNPVSKIELWEPSNPALYTLEISIMGKSVEDNYSRQFGFREAKFTPTGFYLNGKLLKITGVNRHQSFPYKGYAMGKRAQQFDADYIKHRLGFNLVRTSHYPQCPHFLDRCDQIGLLVFEEIAGWQHIGDDAWQKRAIDNVQSMIERDWNHPSIILWGTRINESPDDHDFYSKTHSMAKTLDPSRQTGGVRCIQNSELLEDVYTMNDFVLSDDQINPNDEIALRTPQSVTGLTRSVPYLVTEYGGHMFPTKKADCENWQQEHVMKHLRVLDASYGNASISGAITWCLFDYNTHRDFGSGDKVCYHGVSDAFRTPKFAAYVYASQQPATDVPILKPVTYWTRGERPAAKALPLIILTNCDSVKITLADGQSQFYFPDRSRFPHLPNAPIVIDEYSIGDLEIGGWGLTWDDVRFTGYLNGEIVEVCEFSGSPVPTTLELDVQTYQLYANCNDSCRIGVAALDQKQQCMPYFDDVLSITTSSNLAVCGPNLLTLDAGNNAFWVVAAQAGEASIVVESRYFGRKVINLTVVED